MASTATSKRLPSEPLMSPFMSLTFYSIAMIAGPIVSFFLAKNLSELFITDNGNIYGAVVAVITVHVVLIAFVMKAFKEEQSLAAQPGQAKAGAKQD